MSDPRELAISFRALPVFRTMRTDLATAMSFVRMSGLEAATFDGSDLGFLFLQPGEPQRNAHNFSVSILTTALLYQALSGYLQLKRLLPRLEDSDVELFLDETGDRASFLDGMAKVRNGVFHFKADRTWHEPKIRVFAVTCDGHQGGWAGLVNRLLDLLYAFTRKCFVGDLKIWPIESYEEIDKIDRLMKAERPEVVAQRKAGETTLADYFEEYWRLQVDGRTLTKLGASGLCVVTE